jgi:serine protease AprX
MLILTQILPISYSSNSSLIPDTEQANYTNVPNDSQTNKNPQEQWWKYWTRDMNRDKIDDIIGYKISNGQYITTSKVTLVVDYDHKPSQTDIQNLNSYGAEIVYIAKYINSVVVHISLVNVFKLIERPEVIMIEDNSEFTITLDTAVPSVGADKVKSDFWFTGKGVTIAVIDTGIDAKHMSLDDMDDDPTTNDPKVIGWYDVINNRSTPYDDNGHGSHVSGIIAGTGAPGKKYVGVAPGAKLVGVKVLSSIGSGSTAGVMKGVEWVIDNKNKYNISVISMSLGSLAIPFITNNGRSAESRLLDTATDQGIVVVVAAGNAGPRYETVGPPGDSEKAITVGSVRDDHIISTYSSRGPVGIPGDMYIKPDVCAPGELVISVKANSLTDYVAASGTSMATPMTAGVVALMLSAKPSLTPTEVKNYLTKSADRDKKIGVQQTPNNDYGWGVINAYATIKEITGGKSCH